MLDDVLSIAIVDDDPIVREIFNGLMEGMGRVTAFASGEAFLEAVAELKPNVVLLDISLPRLDGFAVCRKLRALPDPGTTAVIFVSGHDTPEDRLTAYGAGGDDFVDKSADPEELRIKVERIGRFLRAQASLDAFSKSAQSAAFAAMMSMSEQGHVIEFLRRSFTCDDYATLATALGDSLSAYGIEGMLQLRGRAGTIERNLGEAQPLETSVLASMSAMGRIVEFRSRAVVNYERASILVRNLPVDDTDKVGRLKDHLAILAEVADARVKALDDHARLAQQTDGLQNALALMRARLEDLRERNRTFNYQNRLALDYVRSDVEVTLSTLALSEDQEKRLLAILQQAEDTATAGFDQLLIGDALLNEILQILERLQG